MTFNPGAFIAILNGYRLLEDGDKLLEESRKRYYDEYGEWPHYDDDEDDDEPEDKSDNWIKSALITAAAIIVLIALMFYCILY